jgi:chitinase
VDADTLASEVLPAVEGAPNYGGIMLWSCSYDKDTGFSIKLQGILQNRNNQTGTDCVVLSDVFVFLLTMTQSQFSTN